MVPLGSLRVPSGTVCVRREPNNRGVTAADLILHGCLRT